jgi:dihydrodipicolinate synthase/N-acetylneuraminate lyase
VLYNDRHADFLLIKDDEPALLDYLATLVAKEYVVYNNPRATSDDLAEEMVRMLVRVRRHLPRRR